MLNGEQIDKVRLVLASSGWNEVMKPALVNRGNQALKALVLAREERTANFKGTDLDTADDILRAIIRDCEWMVGAWHNEIATFDHNRRRDELDRQDEDGIAANP